MNKLVVLALRAILVVIALGVVVAQLRIVPVVARVLEEQTGVAVAVPYSVVGVAYGVCILLALVCLWALLSMVRRESIFSSRAFRWVDIMIGAGAVATVLALGLAVHVYVVIEPPLDAPGLVLGALVAVLVATTFALLMVVMRGLLRQATTLRGELDEVV